MSKWKKHWEQYQCLRNQHNDNSWSSIIENLADPSRDAVYKEKKLELHRLNKQFKQPSEKELQFLKKFSNDIIAYENAFNNTGSGVHDDVYALAIYLAFFPLMTDQPALKPGESVKGYAFRGTRNSEYTLRPSIQRLPQGVDEVPTGLKQKRAKQLAAMMKGVEDHLISHGLKSTPQICMAIAQHYGTPSPLIDLTRSIWVALFFATDRSEAGHVGVVDAILLSVLGELETLFKVCTGSLIIVDSLNVPRINNQKGFFVEMPSPSLNSLMVNQNFRFYQKENLYFECPHIGITRNFIYPESDDYKNIKPVDLDDEAKIPPFPDYKELTVDSYITYGNEYLNVISKKNSQNFNLPHLNKERARLVKIAAILHVELQSLVEKNAIKLRASEHSLTRFKCALSTIYLHLTDMKDAPNFVQLDPMVVFKGYSHSSEILKKITLIAKTIIWK
ncbi:FRG domain-containing protein [Paraglaciecola sp. L3A3]|uniref:FRG domain-containing protein n=1 Tax=Paraglaciecola sp. L3A3 TaxID=2686358 RepID=UPI00131AC109|nr:FRG domain-containing protein [Paraglaciecola sp. L3A3]